MSTETSEQGVLFGFEHLVFNPTSESSVAKLHTAWTKLSAEECIEKANQSPLNLVRNAWNALCLPVDAERVDSEFEERQIEQQKILWDYWAGAILLASKGLNAPTGVNFQATKDSDLGFNYTISVREDNAYSEFNFVFVPTTNTIDWNHKFPTMDTRVFGNSRAHHAEEEYHCVFRRGDFTLIEKNSDVLATESNTVKVHRHESIRMARPD